MVTLELEKTKAAIADADLVQVLELAAVIKTRLENLGLTFAEYSKVAFGLAPESDEPETWENIDRELSAHDAGEKSFTLAEMRAFSHS